MFLVASGQDGHGSNLQTSGRFFQVFALASQLTSVKLIWLFFSFKIHLTLFPHWSESNLYMSKVL